MNTKNQLFRKLPSRELSIEIINCFGIKDFNDTHSFSRKDLLAINTVNNLEKLKKKLIEHYLPCKSRTYLNDLNTKNVITILRQIVRIHGYYISSKEKYIKGDKFIIYQLVESKKKTYNPITINNREGAKSCTVTFD